MLLSKFLSFKSITTLKLLSKSFIAYLGSYKNYSFKFVKSFIFYILNYSIFSSLSYSYSHIINIIDSKLYI